MEGQSWYDESEISSAICQTHFFLAFYLLRRVCKRRLLQGFIFSSARSGKIKGDGKYESLSLAIQRISSARDSEHGGNCH